MVALFKQLAVKFKVSAEAGAVPFPAPVQAPAEVLQFVEEAVLPFALPTQYKVAAETELEKRKKKKIDITKVRPWYFGCFITTIFSFIFSLDINFAFVILPLSPRKSSLKVRP